MSLAFASEFAPGETFAFFKTSNAKYVKYPTVSERYLSSAHYAQTNQNEHSKHGSRFDKVKSFESRLGNIEKLAPSTLANFYEPHLKSFSVKPGDVEKLSITSTCYALQTLLSSSDSSLYEEIAIMDTSFQPDTDNPFNKISVRAIVLEILNSEWRDDDLFQVPLLLYTVLEVDKERKLFGANTMDEMLSSRVRQLVESVLKARPRRRTGSNQPLSEYIQFLCCRTFATLYGSSTPPSDPGINDDFRVSSEYESSVGGISPEILPPGTASQLSLALSRCAEVSMNELCRQLAYRSAGDVTSFDIMKLAYSLLSYVTASASLSGTAGRELIRGRGPDPGTRVPTANRQLIKAALAAFFEEQNVDGLWDKGQPIYKSFRRSGRNVGNAFVFATDTLGCLLQMLPHEDFRPHMDALQKTLCWIELHMMVEMIPDYCDPDSGQCYGKPLRGWASPHLAPDSGPQAWSTAQVLTCVSNMRTTVRALIHTDVLTEFKGISLSSYGAKLAAWDRLLDTDLAASENCGKFRTLKEVLEARMIEPFNSNMPSIMPAYSCILFGPPGTAKTTICEALAERMGWDFVVIDTAAFLADGLSNVAGRINYVFERLQALEKTIILFDEIEEFCLDRETPGLGMESRMLTTAMLTAINDLRRAKRSIFFLATNRLRAFDSAITRPGRFDMQLFVGTPNLEARCIQFRQKLSAISLSIESKAKSEHTYKSFLDSVWTKDAMFMNYLEGMQFASGCVNILASGLELTNESMAALLESQAVVMTVKGSVRDEYIASMSLSRL